MKAFTGPLNTTLTIKPLGSQAGLQPSREPTTPRQLHAERAMAGDMHNVERDVMSSEIKRDALPASDLPKSLGKKFDGGKAPLAQGCIGYFRLALEAVAKISEYGAKKYNVPYNEQNWRKVDNARGRYMDAMARHLGAYAAGEPNDPESGLPHMAHAAWNALALIELDKDRHDTAQTTFNNPGHSDKAGSGY